LKRISFFGLIAVLLLLTVNPALAIQNGEPDAGNHPYVGLAVFDDAPGNPAWRCSGTLISETVFLTAGHCTDGAVAARAWFYEDVTYDHIPFPLYPYGGAGSGAIEGTPITNPNYRSVSGQGNALPTFDYRDVGVVILSEPVTMSEYGQLPTAGYVDTLRMKAVIDLVGYGVQVQTRGGGVGPYGSWTGPRVRMFAQSQLVQSDGVISDEFIKLTANPGGGKGGTCFGDSGGADFEAGTRTILAVNSFVTNPNCNGVTYSSRIDIAAVLSWINTFMP
jgi:hypothetical protein